MRILVVEDEKKVANFIKQGLEEEGYAVDWAADGQEGLTLALDGVHDLIVLDLNLPKMDGLKVLQELRKAKIKAPVLLLTIRAMIEDKVLGLDAGADDYLTKPFSFQELLARITGVIPPPPGSGTGSPPNCRSYLGSFPARGPPGNRKNRSEHQGIRPSGLLHAESRPGAHPNHDCGTCLGL